MSGMEALTVINETAVSGEIGVPVIIPDSVVELRVDLDVTQLGPPDCDERQGAIPFGARLMMRAVTTDEPMEGPQLGITVTKIATSKATGTQTAPSRPGGSPDVSGDTMPDEDILTDRD